jgi:hypothetical protein
MLPPSPPPPPPPPLLTPQVREIVTIVRMHNAFDSGLMQYGLIRGTKQPDGSIALEAGAQVSSGKTLSPV